MQKTDLTNTRAITYAANQEQTEPLLHRAAKGIAVDICQELQDRGINIGSEMHGESLAYPRSVPLYTLNGEAAEVPTLTIAGLVTFDYFHNGDAAVITVVSLEENDHILDAAQIVAQKAGWAQIHNGPAILHIKGKDGKYEQS